MSFVNKLLSSFLLLNISLVTAQTWEPERLNYCFKGEKFSIGTFCEDCLNYQCGYFIVSNENPDTEFHHIEDYEFFSDDLNLLDVVIVKQKNTMYDPSQYFSLRYEKGVFDLVTGEMIIPMAEHSIQYNKKDEIFVVNSKNVGSLYDRSGKKLELKQHHNIGFGPMGYFYVSWSTDQAIIFDKNENEVLNFGEYYIYHMIGDDAFLLYEDTKGIKITNKNGDELYKYKCGYKGDYAYNIDYNNNSWFYLSGGCGYDDDVYTLFQDKKGKWIDPIKKFNETNYVSYAAKLTKGYQIESIKENEPAIYVIAGVEDENYDYTESGYILTINGEILYKLEDTPRIIDCKIDEHFIYTFTESGNQCIVYDKSGRNITPFEGNIVVSLKDQIGESDYAVFANPSWYKTYIVHIPTKKVVTLDEVVFSFSSVGDIEVLFK